MFYLAHLAEPKYQSAHRENENSVVAFVGASRRSLARHSRQRTWRPTDGAVDGNGAFVGKPKRANKKQRQSTHTGYDIYSRLTSITDADGTITQRYNDAGELIAVIDQLGNTTSYAYDLLGRRSLESDAMGATTSHLHNIHGRLVRQVDRLGQIVWYGQEGYDSREMWFQYGPGVVPPAIDVATTTEGGGGFDEVQTVTVNAGADGRFRLAFGGETTFYLDYGADPGVVQAALQAMHAIDNVDVARSGDSANGYTYTITFGGTLADTDVDPLLADVSADSDGEIVRIIDHGFDAGGRLLSVADYDPGADLESDTDDTPLSADYVWTYDQLDRVLTQYETIAGLNPAIELASTWDRVNRRTSLAATIGGVADYRNTYAYDFENKPQWIYQQSQSGGHAVAYKRIEFRYNDIGQLTYVNRFETSSTSLGTPSLRSVFEYDDANRLLTLSHKAAEHAVGVDVLAQYDYEYDFAGRITAIDSLIDGRSEFSFSTTDQLTDADHDVHGSASNHNPNEAYTYDANGNRIGSGFIVDAQNRTMSDGVYDYQYDAEGNRIRRTLIADGSYEVNTFDHRHRLVRVDFYNASDVLQQSVTYAYDAFNRMVRRSVDDNGDGQADRDQYFAGFDGDNSTLEFDGPDVGDLAHRRLWGPFIDQLIASEQVDSLTDPGEVDWPVTDHTGTIRDVARLDDVSGDFLIASHRVYSSFGLLTDEYAPATGTASGVDLDYGFTARFTEPLTGMTHHQFRWYDPQLGKWISEDPLGFAAGDINTTRYVANAPLTYTDPTGLIAVNIGDGNDDSRHGGDGFWGNLWGNVKNFGVATKVIGTALWHQNAGWIGGSAGDGVDNALAAGGTAAEVAGTVGSIVFEPLDWWYTGKEIFNDPWNPWSYAGLVPFVPAAVGRYADDVADVVRRLDDAPKKPTLSAHKEGLKKVHEEVGKLPKGKPGKFGSPQAGTPKKGYRLDPPHPEAKPGTAETVHHYNWWDWTKGKKGKGGRSGAIPIEEVK